jgi:hypothetical protein
VEWLHNVGPPPQACQHAITTGVGSLPSGRLQNLSRLTAEKHAGINSSLNISMLYRQLVQPKKSQYIYAESDMYMSTYRRHLC